MIEKWVVSVSDAKEVHLRDVTLMEEPKQDDIYEAINDTENGVYAFVHHIYERVPFA